jgi:hypothetical protein
MKIQTDIHNGKIVLELVDTNEEGKEICLSTGTIDIAAIFDEWEEIKAEQRAKENRMQRQRDNR